MKMLCKNCRELIDIGAVTLCLGCLWKAPWYTQHLYIADIDKLKLATDTYVLHVSTYGYIYLINTAYEYMNAELIKTRYDDICFIQCGLNEITTKREHALSIPKKTKRCLAISQRIINVLAHDILFKEEIYDAIIKSVGDEVAL